MLWLQRSTFVVSLLCIWGGTNGLDTPIPADACSYTVNVKRGSQCSSNDELLATVNALKEEVATLRQQTSNNGGAVFTRWGRTVCPQSSSLVYSGYAAGSYYTNIGGSSELLCLPEEPQWGRYEDGVQGGSYVYGSEYQIFEGYEGNGVFLSTNARDLRQFDIPCAVCYISGLVTVKMYPAMVRCPDGWSHQYNGYLMAGRHDLNASVKPVCLDEAPEILESTSSNHNGALVYNMEARCGSLPCPNYVEGRELACAVCSR